MKTIAAKYSRLEKHSIEGLKKQKPQSEHVEQMIDEEACIYVDQRLVAIYKKVEFGTMELLKTCHHLKFESYLRTNGMLTKTLNINSIPRNPRRDNICRKAKLSNTQPEKHEVFIRYAKKIAKSYRKYFSSAYAGQVKENVIGRKRIDRNYLMKGTPFTGAVANKDCAMNYHFDTANTKDGISCMLIMKGNVAGGELILPELNIGFSCQDDYMLLFDGQKYLHGVTNIIKATGGYRYTVVYYNNKGMHLCLPPEDEFKQNQDWLDRPKQTHFES